MEACHRIKIHRPFLWEWRSVDQLVVSGSGRLLDPVGRDKWEQMDRSPSSGLGGEVSRQFGHRGEKTGCERAADEGNRARQFWRDRISTYNAGILNRGMLASHRQSGGFQSNIRDACGKDQITRTPVAIDARPIPQRGTSVWRHGIAKLGLQETGVTKHFILVAGNIGSGKTSLTERIRLARLAHRVRVGRRQSVLRGILRRHAPLVISLAGLLPGHRAQQHGNLRQAPSPRSPIAASTKTLTSSRPRCTTWAT